MRAWVLGMGLGVEGGVEWEGGTGWPSGWLIVPESVAAKSRAGSSSGVSEVGRAPMRGRSFSIVLPYIFPRGISPRRRVVSIFCSVLGSEDAFGPKGSKSYAACQNSSLVGGGPALAAWLALALFRTWWWKKSVLVLPRRKG